MPRNKNRQHKCGKTCTTSTCTNPRVILRPLLADSSGHGRYRFTSLPASASLFNKPDLSDLRLSVGDQRYYAHRLVLCAASEVFSNMLDERWLESRKRELTLEEDEECAKHFDRFLQYMYTGSIVISESYVFPLFMLADKYVVKPLYGECVKIIENGLKVYLVTKKNNDGSTENMAIEAHQSSYAGHGENRYSATSASEDDSDTDVSDQESMSPVREVRSPVEVCSAPGTSQAHMAAGPSQRSSLNQSSQKFTPHSMYLVASEIFPLVTVMKMLLLCHDTRISDAALYNLEARLSKQISNENYGVWNFVSKQIILMMLKDNFFYCKEYVIFKAVKTWLQFSIDRQSEEIKEQMLCGVRYPILSHQELYFVEKDPIFEGCPRALKLLNSAMRYKLFKECCNPVDEKWTGDYYQNRTVKEDD